MLAKQQNIIPVKILKGAAVQGTLAGCWCRLQPEVSILLQHVLVGQEVSDKAASGGFGSDAWLLCAALHAHLGVCKGDISIRGGQGHAMGATEPVAASGGGIKCAA